MFNHETVLKHELVDSLNLTNGDIAVDCTAGGGGHTKLLLEKVGASGKVYSFDRDRNALEHLQEIFKEELFSGRLTLCHNRFSEIAMVAKQYQIEHKIKGICADIGVSSPQIDTPQRGFSFGKDGPLDMRMDQSQAKDAAQVVNEYQEDELANIFFKFGDEPKSRYVARAIVEARKNTPLRSTLQLAEIVASAIHYRTRSKKHPATKVFQALRIYVNNELGELERLCREGFSCLRPGGRLSIITFHSLEDKFVKHHFNQLAKGAKLPKELERAPLTETQLQTLKQIQGRIIKPFPTLPCPEELERNPRSRSAKQRTIEKLPLETNA